MYIIKFGFEMFYLLFVTNIKNNEVMNILTLGNVIFVKINLKHDKINFIRTRQKIDILNRRIMIEIGSLFKIV